MSESRSRASTRSAVPSVLFICTGNICRSPTAHALLLHKARAAGVELRVDSAAISDEERGRPADRRTVAEARRRGVAMPQHVARQVTGADFTRFDRVIGMTRAHCAALQRLAPPGCEHKIGMLMVHAGTPDAAPAEVPDVPDPWYGGPADFVAVFDMIEHAVDGLLAELQRHAGAAR